ncbi:MAG: LCP family protein [Acidimicrobiales bacterium]
MVDEDDLPISPDASSKRRRRWPRRVAVGLVVVIVLAAAGVGSGYWYLRHELNSVKHFSKKQTTALTAPPAPGKPEDVLLVGSDSRTCIGKNAYNQEGNPQVQSGQRSDTIIVVRMVPSTDSVEMLSIPRDTLVPISGTGGSSKINTAFNSGPNELIATIESDFHIPINHVVVASFCGFTDIVNALGGIYLDFPDPATDAETGLRVKRTGCQLVGGIEALQLVRSRYYYYYPDGHIGRSLGNGTFVGGVYDGMSDWSRIRRQQAFFHAVLDRVRSESLNIFHMNSLLGAVVKDLTVDRGFTSDDMLGLAWHYRHFASAQLRTLVLPTAEGTYDGVLGIAPAVPQASQAVAQFMSFGEPTASQPTGSTPTTKGKAATSPPATASSTTTTTLAATTTSPAAVPTTTSPPSEIVSDTPQTLPELWNPYPCSP